MSDTDSMTTKQYAQLQEGARIALGMALLNAEKAARALDSALLKALDAQHTAQSLGVAGGIGRIELSGLAFDAEESEVAIHALSRALDANT